VKSSLKSSSYRAPTAEQARDFDEFFDTPGTFADLEERLHGLPFSAGFRPFRDVEADCVVLKLYEPLLVPGVQQTEDYMRAVFETHPGTFSSARSAAARRWPARSGDSST
jgi:hypothetical protein